MRYYDAITDFIFVEQEPQKADVIFIPGSGYGELAVRAAELYKQGFSKRIIPSGRFAKHVGYFTGPCSPASYVGKTFETEAEFLAQILLDCGVDAEDILREESATFTYENAIYTWQLLKREKISIKKAILCCQAYHARRSLMYYQLLFPEVEFIVCPVNTQGVSKENWYDDMAHRKLVLNELEHCGSQFLMVSERDGELVDSGDFSCYPNKRLV